MSEKIEMVYEGKAKQVFSTDEAGMVVIRYKDDATAFNGQKKSTVANKGIMNNAISSRLFELMEENGITTHFVRKLSDREQLCRRVEIVPLEVIVRNVITGSMSKRLGIPEGTEIPNVIFEICWKNDDYGDPLINDHHAVAMGLASYEELEEMYRLASTVNRVLGGFFDALGVRLIDFKLEFGRTESGGLVLADEISPDTCRLWDKETGEIMDKDRFRKDLGNIPEGYAEILRRVGGP